MSTLEERNFNELVELINSQNSEHDLNLIKKYSKNVILYYKNGSYVLQNKRFPKNIINEIDILKTQINDVQYHIFLAYREQQRQYVCPYKFA